MARKTDVYFRKTFDFGKIPFYNPKYRANAVDLEVEIRKNDVDGLEYYELSICGNVWNRNHSDILMGGQCLDDLVEYVPQMKNRDVFRKLYGYWKEWHLNGMNAGTPEQEVAIKEWEESGHKYDYTEACEYLKSVGLYEVSYTGLSTVRWCENEPYKYGHGWLVRELPQEVIENIESL